MPIAAIIIIMSSDSEPDVPDKNGEGWWDVVVRTRQPANVRLGQPATYVVEAVGYPGAMHTVAAERLRPRLDERGQNVEEESERWSRAVR